MAAPVWVAQPRTREASGLTRTRTRTTRTCTTDTGTRTGLFTATRELLLGSRQYAAMTHAARGLKVEIARVSLGP